MKSWTKLGVPLAAIAVLIAGSAAAYAAAGRGSAPSVEREQNIRDGGGASLAICAQDAAECVDTITADCPETADCGYGPGVCEPDTACIEPWLMDPLFCPDDVPIDVCFPDARPLMPYFCPDVAGEGDETVACRCASAPPPPDGTPNQPGIEPLPPLGFACSPPICHVTGAVCEPPCGPLPLQPVTFDPAVPPPDADAPVIILPIECPPLPCDIPLPLPEPQLPPVDERYECVPPPSCIEPQPEPPAPELRGGFPCVLPPPDGCIIYPDGSGACPGSSGGTEPTIAEPPEAR